MDRPVLNEAQFIDEINARIRTYDGYVSGRVVPAPQGSKPETATGYNWEGPEGCQSLMSRAYAEVREAFTLQVTPRS